MKYLKMYLEQLFSKKEWNKKLAFLGRAMLFLGLATLGCIFIFTKKGQIILFSLAVVVAFVSIIFFLLFAMKNFYQIVKDFQKIKKQWQFEEVEKKAVNEDQEKKETQTVCSYVPTYFLDLSALEHYSGAFYSDFLTENFSKSLIAPEANAILMTDENTLKRLKEMEDNPEEKMIYMGYTTFIRRHFKVIQAMENFNQDLTKLLETQMLYLIFVTADENMAKQITQNIPMQLKMVSKMNKN